MTVKPYQMYCYLLASWKKNPYMHWKYGAGPLKRQQIRHIPWCLLLKVNTLTVIQCEMDQPIALALFLFRDFQQWTLHIEVNGLEWTFHFWIDFGRANKRKTEKKKQHEHDIHLWNQMKLAAHFSDVAFECFQHANK